MRHALLLVAAVALAACGPTAPDAPDAFDASGVFDGTAGRWVDLTHPFSSSTVYWPTDTTGFRLQQVAYGPTEGGWFYSSYAFASGEHGGTHFDAPIHFAEGGLTAERVPLEGLIGPAAVVDVSGHAHADYLVTVEDLTAWEGQHGPLPEGGILLLRTGWGERYGDRAALLGTDLTGPEAVPQLHFPGLSAEAAQWLVDNRGIVAVGIDTPSIDYGQSKDFRVHVILYAEGMVGFENVADLQLLPAKGAFVVALPMKIEGGSGGPVRIVAFVPKGAAG
jgi:kynurenine formamidase